MAKLGKSYKSVFDMLESEYPENPEFRRSAVHEYDRQKIASHLFVMRNRAGITQAELAERMGMTQGAIAKMEGRGDAVRFNDIVRYARALGLGVALQFTNNSMSRAAQIKYHLQAVERLMMELEDVASDDPDITKGVVRNFVENVKDMLINVIPKWMSKLAPLHSNASEEGRQPDLIIEVQEAEPERSDKAIV